MLYLPAFLETIQYQIIKTIPFEDVNSGLFLSYAENTNCSVECLFNVTSKKVYRLTVTDKTNNTKIQWVGEGLYKDNSTDVKKVNLDEMLFFIRENFDTPKKVNIELELDDDLIIQLAQLANDKGITLDNLVEEILREFIDRSKNSNLT